MDDYMRGRVDASIQAVKLLEMLLAAKLRDLPQLINVCIKEINDGIEKVKSQ